MAKHSHPLQPSAPITASQWLDTADAGPILAMTFADELFGTPVQCRIGMRDGRVEAMFVAAAPSTRWLLKSQLERLRQQLQSKGLAVDDIVVAEHL